MSWFDILKLGHCYRTAFEYVQRELMRDDNTKVLLVHANVTGTGGDVIGHKYGHAFVLDGDTVIDTETNIRMPYEKYVDLGTVEDEIIYEANEAMIHGMVTGHSGPWHDGLATQEQLETIRQTIENFRRSRR